MFRIERSIHFYETDLMGIVHHANYLRLCEEARVAWGVSKRLIRPEDPLSASQFAVLETQVRHIKPLYFQDSVRVELQCRLDKLKLIFEYKIFSVRLMQLSAEARTSHVAVDSNQKLKRPSADLVKQMENETWTETWLLNL